MAVATPAMLPVPIDAASAVMNAWNGVSAPDSPDVRAHEGDAAGLAEPPDLDDAGPDGEEEPGGEQDSDHPGHEEGVGGGLNEVGERGEHPRFLYHLVP